MTLSPLTRHVTRAFRQASAEQLSDGIAWYATARALAAELDPDNIPRAAGVIAALSPQLSWDENVKWARESYTAGIVPARGLGLSRKRAQAILDGAVPLDVLGGDKVRAFFACIIGDPNAVCVDRHAHDVAVGRRCDDRIRNSALSRKGGYAAVATCYVRAAKILDVPAAEVQAVTWIVWRSKWAHSRNGKPLSTFALAA